MRLYLILISILVSVTSIAQSFYLFIGTYTDNGSKGIYVYRFNTNTGKADWVSNTEGVINPSYLAISSNKKNIYAVTETATNNNGSVSSYSFDRRTGALKFVNKQSSGGANPCYVTVNKTNKWIVVANYTGGSVATFPLAKNGSIEPLSQLIQHTGSGVNKERQEKPHVHAAVFSPDEKYIFTPDLGTDKVMIYKFDASRKEPLTAANPAFVASESGNGPRHFTFHPNKKLAYLIEEMSGSIVVFNYDNGTLTFQQRIATHSEEFKGTLGSADIHISPDGKFLYASNRGEENNIAIFSINTSTGLLAIQGYQPTEGRTPRNFIIDPTGKYLLVANQNTNNIVVFKRDLKTGLLQKTGEEISIPKPVCLQMMKQ